MTMCQIFVLIGGWLRFFRLGEKSLWYDEAVIYHIIQGDWLEILGRNATESSAPPLYPLLLGLITEPFDPESTLRALSALAGTLTIPVLYLLARQFVTGRVAWLVALLAAVAPTQILYAQQLREYSATVGTSALLFIAYHRFIMEPTARRAAFVSAAAILGLLIQYGIGLLLVSLNIVCLTWFAATARPLSSYVRWACTQVPPAAVAVALYLMQYRHQIDTVSEAVRGYLAPNYWDGSASNLLTLLVSTETDIVGFAFPGVPFKLLVLAGAGAWLFGRGSRLAAAFLLAPIAATYLAAVAGVYPYGAIRQDIFLTPMLYVCAALGAECLLAALPERPAAVTRLLPMALLTVVLAWPAVQPVREYYYPKLEYQPMRGVVQALATRLRRGEPIYVYFNAIPAFSYYWGERPDPWIRGAAHQGWRDPEIAGPQMQAVRDEIGRMVGQGCPCWVVLSHMEEHDVLPMIRFLERSAQTELVAGNYGSWLLRLGPPGGVTAL